MDTYTKQRQAYIQEKQGFGVRDPREIDIAVATLFILALIGLLCVH